MFAAILAVFRQDDWVRPLLARYGRTMALSIFLGVLAVAFAVGLMFVSGYLISDAAEMPELGLYALLVPLGLVQVFGIAKPFMSYFERLASHDWVLRLTSSLREKLYSSAAADRLFWTRTRRTGEALGLLADDIGHIQDLYIRCIFPLAIAWIAWVGYAVLCGVFNWWFAIVMLAALSFFTYLLPKLAALGNGERNLEAKEVSLELYERAYDDVAGLADWVFSQRRSDYVARIDASNERIDALWAATARFERGLKLAARIAFSLLAFFVFIWAAYQFSLVDQGMAAAGIAARPAEWIAAFVLGFFPLLEVFLPLSDGTSQLEGQLTSIERLNAFGKDAAPAGAAESGAVVPDGGRVKLMDVAYTYPDEGKAAVSGVSLELEPGTRLAVLGPSGSGKTTLAQLIRGNLKPADGMLDIGGVEPSTLGPRVSELVGYVEQQPYLFNMTLFENLRIGKPEASRDEVAAVLESVGLGELLARLPQGLDTVVDEGGRRFSGGERHRIALARVLLQDTPIVVLDEPAAHLDPATESALLQTIFRVFAGRTVIMVTHHLLGIERFDRVVFMDNGRITLDGTPAELAEGSERYRRLLDLDRGL